MDWINISESVIGSLIAAGISLVIGILGAWIFHQGKKLANRYRGKEKPEEAKWLSFRRRAIIGSVLFGLALPWVPNILESTALVAIWYDILVSLASLLRLIFMMLFVISLIGILSSEQDSEERIVSARILIVAGVLFALISGVRGHLERERAAFFIERGTGSYSCWGIGAT